MPRLIYSFLMFFFITLSFSQSKKYRRIYSQMDDLRKTWYVGGLDIKNYIGGGNPYSKDNPGYIKSNSDKNIAWSTFMINDNPKTYSGKKIKFTVYIKSENIRGTAKMFFRLDNDNEILLMRRMDENPLSGTSEYRKLAFYANIPPETTNIAYGMILSGTGTAYFKNLTINIVH